MKANSPELLIVGGKPYSGKSSICKSYAENSGDVVVAHLSMGDRLRGINSGEIESKYFPQLSNDTNDLKTHKPINDPNIPIGVFEEFIELNPADIYILDAFPRYQARLHLFMGSVRKLGAGIIAVCHVGTPDEVCLDRSQFRKDRYDDVIEDVEFVRRRLEEFKSDAELVLKSLSDEYGYPYYALDGTEPVESNADKLRSIYQKYRSNNS